MHFCHRAEQYVAMQRNSEETRETQKTPKQDNSAVKCNAMQQTPSKQHCVSKINKSLKLKYYQEGCTSLSSLHFSQVYRIISPGVQWADSILWARGCLVARGDGAALIPLFLKVWTLLILKPAVEVEQEHLTLNLNGV